MLTIPELRAAARRLYDEHFAARIRGDEQAAAALKVRAEYLDLASVTGYRMPEVEALALKGAAQ